MLIIGIAGGTGSGKTTVVRKIIESLPAGEVVLLPQDSYYKDSSHVPVEERQNINFDHPDAFEWSLLSRHVAMLREGKSIEPHLLIPDVYTPARNHPYRPPGSHHHRRYPCLVRQETAKHDGPQDICRR